MSNELCIPNWIAHCTQFLSEKRLNGFQIFKDSNHFCTFLDFAVKNLVFQFFDDLVKYMDFCGFPDLNGCTMVTLITATYQTHLWPTSSCFLTTFKINRWMLWLRVKGQTDRQTDRQIDRQTDRQTDRSLCQHLLLSSLLQVSDDSTDWQAASQGCETHDRLCSWRAVHAPLQLYPWVPLCTGRHWLDDETQCQEQHANTPCSNSTSSHT